VAAKLFRADGQTVKQRGRRDEAIVAFRNFANVPKMMYCVVCYENLNQQMYTTVLCFSNVLRTTDSYIFGPNWPIIREYTNCRK
jgi:hypothetical protein